MAQVIHNDDCARFIPGPVQQITQTKDISVLGRLGRKRSMQGKEHEIQSDPSASNGTVTLTDSSPISKDRRTRIWLRVISQEPFRIEFHRIGILGRVVQNLPVYQIQSPWEKNGLGNDLDEKNCPFYPSLTRRSRLPWIPWE